MPHQGANFTSLLPQIPQNNFKLMFKNKVIIFFFRRILHHDPILLMMVNMRMRKHNTKMKI